MLATGYGLLIAFVLVALLWVCCECCDYYNRPPNPPPPESAEQRLARVWAEWQALAARAEAVLVARAEVALTGQPTPTPTPAPAPLLLPLPYFSFSAQPQGDKQSGMVVCAICLEPLRLGQLCSEVPLCRHAFHNVCLGEWARNNGSCPLCRAKIVPGSDEVAVADDMV